MRRIFAAVVVLLLTATACAADESDPARPADSETGEIYAATAFHLATESNTFGAGHRFSELLVVDHTVFDVVESAGTGPRGPAYSESEAAAIRTRLETLSPVRFVESASDWRTDDLQPTVPGSAIITLGPADLREDGTAAVGVSLWCGGLCGFWTLLVLQRIDGMWMVVGQEGPSIIS